MAELKYDIVPKNTPLFASDVVHCVEKFEGVTLDYSVKSLEVIDSLVARFRENGSTVDDMAATLFSFGCYLGEVIVKNAGGKWRKATQDELDNVFGMPLVLDLKNGVTLNPIGKVIKRLENGEEDSIPYFYQACVANPVR